MGPISIKIRKQMPGYAVSALLLGGLAMGVYATSRLTGGRVVYPLDDTYIHLEMARTLSQTGTWGINPGHFEPASSSPLWTALLGAIFAIFESHHWVPLLINAVLVVVMILVMHHWIAEAFDRASKRAFVLAIVIVLAALPTVAFAALETVLHALLYLCLILASASHLADHRDRRTFWTLLLITALCAAAVLTRFETLFTAGIVTLLALGCRRFGLACALAAGAALAVGGYSLWSLSQGGLWLPNPILIKGRAFDGTPDGLADFALRLPNAMARINHAHLTGLMAVGVLLLMLRPQRTRTREWWVLLILIFASLAQMQFARLGWLFRYEMFLLIPFMLSLTIMFWGSKGLFLTPWGWRKVCVGVAAGITMIPLTVRAAKALEYFPKASRNIYEQQIQMARFAEKYYRGDLVAANDIGALAYVGEAHVIDLWGLADTESAIARIRGHYSPEHMARRARERGAAIAIIYERWYARTGGLPTGWHKIGEWQIQDNVICGDDTVSFYALSHDETDRLAARLKEFAAQLPRRVRWDITHQHH